jgi:[ribosomal protein S5]-alanine N-acetyltransferase
MAIKDEINLIFRWPVMKALRNRIGRIFPGYSGQRKLKMQVLETERIVLRQFVQNDLEEIAVWEEIASAQNAGAAAQEFLDYCFREYRGRGIGPWGIQLKETGAIVGNCGFPDLNFKELRGEVNYYIVPHHRGRGLATEALLALFTFGFQEVGLARIQARCDTENLASERVMQKAGMRFEGFVEHAPSSEDPEAKKKIYSILKNDIGMKSHRTFKFSIKMAERSGPRT